MNPVDGQWELVSAAQMQALDRYTIDSLGVPGDLLMESAGRALVAPVLELRAQSASGAGAAGVLILCGTGNNGGDGLVLARHLLAMGIPAEVLRIGDAAKGSADAAQNWQRLERIDAPRKTVMPEDSVRYELPAAAVVVDALFGTGLSRPLEGDWADWMAGIARARARGAKVLSVDLPSGLSADTGQILGHCVEADLTVTISAPKVGLALEPGRSLAGEVRVARVGIADDCSAVPSMSEAPRSSSTSAQVHLWNRRAALRLWPQRPRAGHKGSFGRVLVVGGSTGLLGAVGLCARGTLRAGAGLVTAALPQLAGEMATGVPTEAMTHCLAATAEGSLDPLVGKGVLQLAERCDAVAAGPGLGRAEGLRSWWPEVIEGIPAPLVLDADGLNVFAGQVDRLRDRSAPTVLTPHPGEAATLLGEEAAALNHDRVGAARRLAEQTGAIVLLKGAATVVVSPEGRALIVPTGGPILATGGTGDVLTGIIAALLGQGVDAFDAAGLGAWWHGAAADAMAAEHGSFGMLASELADRLPGCLRDVERGVDEARTREGDLDGADLNGRGGQDALLLRFP